MTTTPIQHSAANSHMAPQRHTKEEEYEDAFDVGSNSVRDSVPIEPKGSPGALQKLFGDPEKMLHLWLQGEAKPNPFADNTKDPMESFGKFVQSMLMQTQTDALSKLEGTMTRNQQFAASSLTGEVIEVESNKMTISPGKRISETFTVPEEADAFSVNVINAAGETVFQNIAYDPGAGITKFEWPGTDNDGKELPAGEYKISIELLKKHETAGAPPRFEHLEYAKTLDSQEIKEKRETLSAAERDVQFSYEIPEGLPELEHASIWITNSKGTPVHKGEIDVKTGERGVYSWNGLDRSGARVPEDEYSISINFKDAKRKIIKTDEKPTIRVSGKVNEVEMNESGEPNVVTSRIKAPLSSIRRIANEQGL